MYWSKQLLLIIFIVDTPTCKINNYYYCNNYTYGLHSGPGPVHGEHMDRFMSPDGVTAGFHDVVHTWMYI